ncbi:MAG TPA: ThiF family adenylyltransferase [Candidatus Angelobacter sp.]|jgi:adenylyltransferase/sulfurtransferase|nr:ThiF family adenylyltransferase [Candidatus Angelobacter sp.]
METTSRSRRISTGSTAVPGHKTLQLSALEAGDDRFARARDTQLNKDRLSNLNFVVIGAGALGNEVVKALGLLGSGSVAIVDPDNVERSNLSRSVFFRDEDCGRPKALALCEALARAFPDTRWKSHECEIADFGLEELAGCQMIMSCVDTDIARVETAWAALALDLPVADAGLGGPDYWHGRVSLFAGQRSACFCCKLSPRRRQEILALAQATGQSCWAAPEIPPIPSTPTMAAITASLQVNMGIRSLFDLQTGAKEYLSWTTEILLGSSLETRRFSTPQSGHCPLHGSTPRPLAAPPHDGASARELLESVEMEVLELDWPICVSAGCLDCGHIWSPRRRVAWLRRYGKCPHCQSRHILEKENIHRLERGSHWASNPLIELGLPQRHLYTVRPGGAKEQT